MCYIYFILRGDSEGQKDIQRIHGSRCYESLSKLETKSQDIPAAPIHFLFRSLVHLFVIPEGNRQPCGRLAVQWMDGGRYKIRCGRSGSEGQGPLSASGKL